MKTTNQSAIDAFNYKFSMLASLWQTVQKFESAYEELASLKAEENVSKERLAALLIEVRDHNVTLNQIVEITFKHKLNAFHESKYEN